MTKTTMTAAQRRAFGELSPVTGSTASQVANRLGVSTSTARKYLAELREAGVAKRDPETGEWTAGAVDDERSEPSKPAKKSAKPKKPPQVVPEATRDEDLERALATSLAGRSPAAFLQGIGFRPRVAEQDGSLVDLLRAKGPLTKDEVLAELDLPGWSFRRMCEGKHGDLTFDPLVEVVGRGDDRKYRATV